VDHRATTVGTERGRVWWGQRFGRFQVGGVRLPSGAFGIGQLGRLSQESAHPIEFDAPGRVEPAEAADAVEAGGQDVLEKAADQFAGFQVEVLPVAGGTFAITPADPAVGEAGQVPVGGGGLEDVTAEVTQGGLARAGGLTMHDPALFPDPRW
jgi:hypothetical protein